MSVRTLRGALIGVTESPEHARSVIKVFVGFLEYVVVADRNRVVKFAEIDGKTRADVGRGFIVHSNGQGADDRLGIVLTRSLKHHARTRDPDFIVNVHQIVCVVIGKSRVGFQPEGAFAHVCACAHRHTDHGILAGDRHEPVGDDVYAFAQQHSVVGAEHVPKHRSADRVGVGGVGDRHAVQRTHSPAEQHRLIDRFARHAHVAGIFAGAEG